MSPVLYPEKRKKRHILRSLSALIHDRVWHLSLSETSPVIRDKESQLFAITDKTKCFAHFHIGKEINFCSAYCYFSVNICLCFLWDNPTEYPVQYSKYPVISCEARNAMRWKSRIPQGFQDLAKMIPLGACFEEKLNGSCHAWELHKAVKCPRGWEDPPRLESIPLQKWAGRLGPASPQLLPAVILRRFCCSLPCFSLVKLQTFQPVTYTSDVQSVVLLNICNCADCQCGSAEEVSS